MQFQRLTQLFPLFVCFFFLFVFLKKSVFKCCNFDILASLSHKKAFILSNMLSYNFYTQQKNSPSTSQSCQILFLLSHNFKQQQPFNNRNSNIRNVFYRPVAIWTTPNILIYFKRSEWSTISTISCEKFVI